MPTARPRHMLTETPALAAALDEAAAFWPALRDDRAALLRKLVDAGREAIAAEAGSKADDRRRALRAASGLMTGIYPADALTGLRAEWPR